MVHLLSARTLLVLSFLLIASAGYLCGQSKEKCRYIKTAAGYLMLLLQGADLFSQLEGFAHQEQIPSANFIPICTRHGYG
ncbi:hypothetical protein CK934_08515 [Chitinophaga sp. MD30]|nr:hypothetical protein CK934_08515 [Chitinophaga sp. MD30]